jgi:DNA-binding NtrC family response regulator
MLHQTAMKQTRPAAAATRRPTIALIEDDPLVRAALATAISDASYTVVSAASGAEGLAVLESRPIDLAIIDIVIPGRLNGIDIVREAKRFNPDLRVIFTSGHPVPPGVNLSALGGSFLAKPARVPALLAEIERKLDD